MKNIKTRGSIRTNMVSDITKASFVNELGKMPNKKMNRMVKNELKKEDAVYKRTLKRVLDKFMPDNNGIIYKGKTLSYEDLFTKSGVDEEYFIFGLCYAITQTSYLYEIGKNSPYYNGNQNEIISEAVSEEILVDGAFDFYNILNRYRNEIDPKDEKYIAKILYNNLEQLSVMGIVLDDDIVVSNDEYLKEADKDELLKLSALYIYTPDIYSGFDYLMFDLWTIYIRNKKAFFTMTIELFPYIMKTIDMHYLDYEFKYKLPTRLTQQFETSLVDTEKKDCTFTNFADFYLTSALRYYLFLNEDCSDINSNENIIIGMDVFAKDVDINDLSTLARRSYTRCLGIDIVSDMIKENKLEHLHLHWLKNEHFCTARVRLVSNGYYDNNTLQKLNYAGFIYVNYYLSGNKEHMIDNFRPIEMYRIFKGAMLSEFIHYSLYDIQSRIQRFENTELKTQIEKMKNQLTAMQRENKSLVEKSKKIDNVDAEQLATYKTQNENLSNIITEKNVQIESLLEEINSLKRENESLQQDIDLLLEDDDCSSDVTNINVPQDDKIDFINEHNITLIGGRSEFDLKLDKAGLINYEQLETVSEIKKNITHTDAIIICSKFVSHSMTYMADSYFKDVPKMYFNQTNVDAFIDQVYEFLKNNEEKSTAA